MSFLKTSRFFVLSSIIVVMILAAIPVNAQLHDLEIKVDDAEGRSGQQDVVVSINMKNWADTVAGFELFLVLEHNLVCEFQVNDETIYDSSFFKCYEWVSPGECNPDSMLEVTDSVLLDPLFPYDSAHETIREVHSGNHDVVGTLIENWEEVSSASLGTGGHDLKIMGRANTIAPPYTKGIGFPQWGTVPLVKILADIYEIPEDQEETNVKIYIQKTLGLFGLSNEDGYALGVAIDTITDTSWFDCIDWDGEVCLDYVEVGEGPADTFTCCDTIYQALLDTSIVSIEGGILTVLPGMCGDVNCNEAVNLLDITYLISYLYKGGPAPCEMWRAYCNEDAAINLLDITYLIKYLYKGGPEPLCGGK